MALILYSQHLFGSCQQHIVGFTHHYTAYGKHAGDNWDPEVHGNYLGQLEPHMLLCYWNEEYVVLAVNWIACSLLISQLQYYNMFYCASIHQPHTEWLH